MTWFTLFRLLATFGAVWCSLMSINFLVAARKRDQRLSDSDVFIWAAMVVLALYLWIP